MWGEELYAGTLWGDQPGTERIAPAAAALVSTTASVPNGALALALSAAKASVAVNSPVVSLNGTLPLGAPPHADASTPNAAITLALLASTAGIAANAPAVIFVVTLPGVPAEVTASSKDASPAFVFPLALASVLATAWDAEILVVIGLPNKVSFLVEQKDFFIVTFSDDAQRPVMQMSDDTPSVILSVDPGEPRPVTTVTPDEPSIILTVE